MRTPSFQPSRDGFAFANAVTNPGHQFGLSAPLARSFGLSAGMAWVALDRYLAGRPIPSATEPPVATDPLHRELIARQSNALAVAPWGKLVEWQCLPDRGGLGRVGLAELSRAQWRKARRSLDRGVPVLLFLVIASGRHANPSLNRAVLAAGYELDRRARRVTLRVYDPARPGNDGVRVVFRLGGRFVPLAARLAVDTAVRGFFLVPYDRPIPAALTLGAACAINGRVIESVVAPLQADRAGDPLDVLAREGSGGLLHLHRDARGRWSAADVRGRSPGPLGANAAPRAVAVLGPDHIIARGGSGELLEYRRLPVLGWRTRSITRSQRIGDAFRIDGDPAALRDSQGRTTVIACRNGKLVRYQRGRWSTWSADHLIEGLLGKTVFQGTPAVAELARNALHVLCRTESGDLMHLRLRDRAGAVVENVTTRAGGRDRFVVSQDPIAVTDRAGKMLNVVARSNDGGVLLFRWTARRGWRGVQLSVVAARDAGVDLRTSDSALSAALDFEGTVHVVARDTRGGLIHVWSTRDGATGGEEITCGEQALGESGTSNGPPQLAVGPAEALHVFARQGTGLHLYRWTPVGGWNAENVTLEQSPSGSVDALGDATLIVTKRAVHAAFVDCSGRVQHLCAESGSAQRRSRVGRNLLAGLAGAAAAPLALVSSMRFDFTALRGLVEHTTRGVRGLASHARNRARPAASGIGARFLPSGARTGQLVRPTAAGKPQPGGSTRRGSQPATPIQAPASRSLATSRTVAKPKPTNAAVKGLPLLGEDGGSKSAAPIPPPSLPATPAAPRKNSRARDLHEMQRVMALAEESAPELLPAIGGK